MKDFNILKKKLVNPADFADCLISSAKSAKSTRDYNIDKRFRVLNLLLLCQISFLI